MRSESSDAASSLAASLAGSPTPVNLGASLRRALPVSVDALRGPLPSELPWSTIQNLVGLAGTGQDGLEEASSPSTQVLRCWENESLEILSGEDSVRRAWFGEPRMEWSERWGFVVTDKVRAILRSGTPMVKASIENFGDPVRLMRKVLIVELNGHGDWETLWHRRCAANDELCSENGRLRGEIERLRREVEAMEVSKDLSDQQKPSSVKKVDDDLLACVLLAAAAALKKWKQALPSMQLDSSPADLSNASGQSAERHVQSAEPEVQQTRPLQEEEEEPGQVQQQPLSAAVDPQLDEEQEQQEVAEAEQHSGPLERIVAEAASPGEVEERAHVPAQTETVQEDADKLQESPPQPEEEARRQQEEATESAGELQQPAEEVQQQQGDAVQQPAEDLPQQQPALAEQTQLDTEEHPQQLRASAADVDGSGEERVASASAADVAVGSSPDAGAGEEDQEGCPAVRKASFHSCEGLEDAAATQLEEMQSNSHEVASKALDLDDLEFAVNAAVANAFLDADGLAHKAIATLSPAEETAALVHEKIALRELVEGQADRIVALEMQLSEAGAETGSPFLGNVLAGGALGVLTSRGLGNLSDASGALSAGLSAVLTSRQANMVNQFGADPQSAPAFPTKVATVGAEYEVVGKRGAVVRETHSLNSDFVADLPPGTRVRVVGLSEEEPRRIEVVARRVLGGQSKDAKQAPQDEAAPPSGEAGTGDPSSEAAQGEPAMESVLGWISAVTLRGDWLIRQISQREGGGAEGVDSQEEGSHEIDSVTLSAEEWQLLHLDRERAMQRVADFTARLNAIGSQLLQSFEMRTVLSELQLTADRAQDRRIQMREIVAMSAEEVGLWRDRWQEVLSQQPLKSPSRDGHPTLRRGATSSSSLGTPKGDEVGERVRDMEDVDWHKLVTERETTAAALSAALQRVSSLRREADELEQERVAAEGRGHGELSGLRQRLRHLAGQARRLPGRLAGGGGGFSQESSNARESSEAALSLFRNRIKDLEQQVRDARDQISLASTTEVALQRTLDARKSTLRKMLCRQATWDLVAPDCGVSCAPFGGTLLAGMSGEAERKALRIAVEEQLRFNLQLTKDGAETASRQLQILPSGIVSEGAVDGSSREEASAMSAERGRDRSAR